MSDGFVEFKEIAPLDIEVRSLFFKRISVKSFSEYSAKYFSSIKHKETQFVKDLKPLNLFFVVRDVQKYPEFVRWINYTQIISRYKNFVKFTS